MAASKVHWTKRNTSTTVTMDPDAIASMIARDIPMLPSLRQLAIGLASACARTLADYMVKMQLISAALMSGIIGTDRQKLQ